MNSYIQSVSGEGVRSALSRAILPAACHICGSTSVTHPCLSCDEATCEDCLGPSRTFREVGPTPCVKCDQAKEELRVEEGRNRMRRILGALSGQS